MKNSQRLLLLCSLTLANHAGATDAPKTETPAPSAAATAPPDAGRRASLHEANTLDGATGLLRVRTAGSAAVGTFRLSLSANLYSGSSFLCPNCENAQGDVSTQADDVNVFGTRAQLSLTPLAFLEAYASLRHQTSTSSRGTPRVIPIAGDTTFGAKAFLPEKTGRIWGFGGGFSAGFLSPTDGVGVSTANLELYLAGTLDFTQLATASRIPLRVHANLGYYFDNSGKIADAIESDRNKVLASSRPITRVERFGYGINRVDAIKWGLGVEGTFDRVRPFAEWTLDLPANRQDYLCQMRFRSAGDRCLSRDQTLSSFPSRLTVGVRGYPWLARWAEGLVLLLAADIGTGATSNFVEEIAPEAPYSVHVGVGYAFDTKPRIERVVVTQQVAAPPAKAVAPPQFYVAGTVVDAETSQPVKEAGVFFEGSDQNAMLTSSNGSFRTASLTPGEHRFVIKKDDYRDGQCQAMITGAAPTTPSTGAPAPNAAANANTNANAADTTEIRCELSPTPRVATVTGELRSTETTEFVVNANVVAKDVRGRNAAVTTDADGRFRFENVPAGKLRIEATAQGYLASVTEIDVQPRLANSSQIFLNKRPAQASIVLTKTELKLKRQVHFLFDSAEIQPDSASILEEIAELLRAHAEVAFIEIQGHTDDVGSPDHNLRLSEDRAHAVRDALVRLGVDGNRLSARGYGKQTPLVPNVSPQNRAKNRRVQLMIQNP